MKRLGDFALALTWVALCLITFVFVVPVVMAWRKITGDHQP